MSITDGAASKNGEPTLLAPDYHTIVQLPPNKSAGYFMAPSLVKLPSGALIASVPHGLPYHDGGQSLRSFWFYRSEDGGLNWEQVSNLPYDSCEPNLFVHESRLYVLFTPNQNNTKMDRSMFPRDGRWGIWISVSDDEGSSWSPAKRVFEGPAMPDKPTPQHSTGGEAAMLVSRGKLYLSVSDWFQSMAAVSCDLDKGILNPDAWRVSEMVDMPIPAELVYEPFRGGNGMRVLEGNVVEVSGKLLVIARTVINGGATCNMGAIYEIEDEPDAPLRLRFIQLYPIPGGQMKFYIEYDSTSKLFWMASNLPSNSAFLVEEGSWAKAKITHAFATDRRSLLLWYSVDALNWFPAGWVARARGWTQSFHYPVMHIDGDDIILISRTARDSGNQHDVDMATFHRIKNFRSLAVNLIPE